MNLEVIRTLCDGYHGGLKRLSSDIGMSEANLHRCINNNKIQASDLENIAIRLGVDITIFFESTCKINSQNSCSQETAASKDLLNLCKLLIDNFKQRDEVVSQLVSMVKKMEY